MSSPNAILNLEDEFVCHLAKQKSVEYILREGVSPKLLFVNRTQVIFNFVEHYFNTTGKVPSLKVLQTEYPKYDFVEPESSIEWVIDSLRKRHKVNEIKKITEELVDLRNDPDAAMKRLREEVFELEKNTISSKYIWTPGDHKIFLRDYQQKVLAGAFKGATVGFPEIDKLTGGIKDGNLAYIMARPKRQKTFLTVNAFIEQAKEGKNPYLFTLENTAEEIILRISCMISGISWDKAIKGNLDMKDYKKLNTAWDDFSKYDHTIEQPPLDERTIPALLLKADKRDAGSILISQFRYIDGLKDWYVNSTEKDAEVAVDLKRAATRPGSERPIIVEAQFNRGGDTMEELADFNPSKVGLTDMITQGADTLYGIFQSKDLKANNQLEFGILEARSHISKVAWFVQTEYVNGTAIKLASSTPH